MRPVVLCEDERCLKSPVTRKYGVVFCASPATTTRKNRHVLNGPKLYNFCAECAADRDEYESELEFESRVS